MTSEQQLIIAIVLMVVASFSAGCSIGSTFRTKHPRKATAHARRK